MSKILTSVNHIISRSKYCHSYLISTKHPRIGYTNYLSNKISFCQLCQYNFLSIQGEAHKASSVPDD